MGGSSRPDVQSLALLNPLMIACCGVGLLSLRPEQLEGKKSLLAGILFAILLVATYLVPIAGQLMNFSGGAGDVATVRAAADVSAALQLLSMAPAVAWQSLFFLFAPLAVLLSALQLNRDDMRLSVPLVIAVGAISGLIGVLQLAGGASGPLYFYDITNDNSAVGLFANRNHAAVFLSCLFPILGVFAARSHATRLGSRNARQLIAIAITVVLIPLILVTGSRSGLLTAITGLIGGALLYTSSGQTQRGSQAGMPLPPMLAIAVAVCVVFATIYLSRAEAIERIFAENGTANDRANYWTSGVTLFWKYFPFGIGPGSFVSAVQADEPVALLSGVYLNRLHNDWLETGLTYGALGLPLMLGGVCYYFWRCFHLWFRQDGTRTSAALGRMASVVIAILSIASLTDYPLRTPAMMGFAVLICVWFIGALPERRSALETAG